MAGRLISMATYSRRLILIATYNREVNFASYLYRSWPLTVDTVVHYGLATWNTFYNLKQTEMAEVMYNVYL